MFKKLDLQYSFSYLGLFPYLLIIIDKYYFYQIKEEIILDFIIYYTLFIIIFIGSINWSFETKVKGFLIVYGFLPSLFSVIVLCLNLYDYNSLNIILCLNIFLLAQLLFDYFFIFSSKSNKKKYYFIRLPLTIVIIVISRLIIL